MSARPAAARFALLLAAFACCGRADFAAAGAWTSYIHPYRFDDLLPRGDTLWCATLEAGVVRYQRTTDGPGGPGTGPPRFDGYTREPGGLSSNAVTALALDRGGRLWVGTEDAGVSRLSADRSSWDLLSGFDGLLSDSITTLAAVGDTMWIGSTRGVALWDGREIAGNVPDGVNPSPFADDHVTSIVPRGDSLWVATRNGIYVSRLSTGLQSWAADTAGLASPQIFAMAQDAVSLLAYGSGQVYSFNFNTGRWGIVGSLGSIGQVSRLGARGGPPIASTSTGLWAWNGVNATWTQLDNVLQSDPDPTNLQYVFTTAFDAGGRLFASNIDGIREMDTPGSLWVLHAPPSPPGNDIINCALQGTTVYTNTYAQGVGRFDGQTWRNWPAASCSGPCDTTFANNFFPFGLMVDARGHKWDACWSTTTEEFDDSVSPPSFIHHDVPDPVQAGQERHTFGWAMVTDPDGGHWIGLDANGLTDPTTALGLDDYDVNGKFVRNFRPDSVPSMGGTEIRALAVDANNHHIWVGYAAGSHGLQYFDWRSPPAPPSAASALTFSTPTDPELPSLGSLDVVGLALHGDSLWARTGADLRRFSARSADWSGETYSGFGATDKNSLHPLDVGPDGSVWLGAENGLTVIHPGGASETFTTSNSPLAANSVRAVRVDPNGVVWIATGGGLNRYDPGFQPGGTPLTSSLKVKLYPNPAFASSFGATISVSGNASGYSGTVYDITGRAIRSLSGGSNGKVFWDGRDDHGSLVRPGVYLVRIEAQGRSATARVVLLR